MRVGPLVGLSLTLAAAPSAAAQRTGDQARLVFNISAAYIGGQALWRAPEQPVFDNTLRDVFRLERRVRPNLGAALSGFYFPGDNFGIGFEGFLIGLGYEDRCTVVEASGSSRNQEVCGAIDGRDIGATSVSLAGSAVYRFNSRRTISPYVRVNAGALISSRSSVEMISEILVDPPGAEAPTIAEITIYPDDTNTDVSPAFGAALGLTAALAPGYRLRWEVRNNLVFLREVTAASARNGDPPRVERELHNLFSLAVGIDIVLERRRGRRY